MEVQFTQFLMPDGRKRPQTFNVDDSLAAEVQAVKDYVAKQGSEAILCQHWEKGSEGSAELATRVAEIADADIANFAPLYPDEMNLFEKIETVAKRIYRADEVLADKSVRDQLRTWEEAGYGHFPVCMAKT